MPERPLKCVKFVRIETPKRSTEGGRIGSSVMGGGGAAVEVGRRVYFEDPEHRPYFLDLRVWTTRCKLTIFLILLYMMVLMFRGNLNRI